MSRNITTLQRGLRRARRRAYTLVELGVVVVLTTLLIFGMVRWLVSVGASASSGLQDASDSRSALVFDQMAKDVRALQHCQAAGTDARVVSVTTDAMTLILDSDGDGTTETVRWRISGDTIQRGTAQMGADCTPGTISDWADWLSGADALTFSVFRDGAEETFGTLGVCEVEIVDRCRVALLGASIDAGQGSAAERRVFDVID